MNFNPKIILEFDSETFELEITLNFNTSDQYQRLKHFLEKNYPKGFETNQSNIIKKTKQ